MRTYFDLDEFETFNANAEAMRQYLKRNQLISQFNRIGYQNLLIFMRKSFQLKLQKHLMKKEKFNKELGKLKQEMQIEAAIFNKSWLLSKIKDLE